MTSNVKWGVVAGIAAVIAGAIWAGAQMYWPADESGETGPVAVSDEGETTGEGGETGQSAEGAAQESGDEESGDGNRTQSAQTEAQTDQEMADAELQEEAESYVSELAEPSEEPVSMEEAETFVGSDRPLAAGAQGDADQDDGDPGNVAGDNGAAQGAAGQDETEGAAGDASGETEPRTRAEQRTGTEDGDVTGMEIAGMEAQVPPEPPAGAEARSAPPPETAEPVIEQAASAGDTGTGSPDQGETPQQPRVDLPLTEEAPVTIAELLGPEEDIPPDAVYYVHSVQPENVQGIWGIVHHGILENFARGVAVHRGEETRTYQVDIPRNADEKEADESSSFLGRLIYEKSRQSYVYNFKTDRLGRNPDLIIPGQEIVIVSFTPEELIAVYKHFARQGG